MPSPHCSSRWAGTYIGEEDARDTTLGMEALLVALGRVVATGEAPLVACHRILMRLEAAIVAQTKISELSAVILAVV